MLADYEQAARALAYVPADDRDLWVRMAFACYAGFGEDGRELWLRWSRSSAKYQQQSAMTTWRSAKSVRRVRLSSLFATAREYGWRPDDTSYWKPPLPELSKTEQLKSRMREADAELRAAVARATAVKMLMDAEYDRHEYLASKGFLPFPKMDGVMRQRWLEAGYTGGMDCGLVGKDGRLLLSMRNALTGSVSGLQAIAANGAKQFLPYGSRIADCFLRIGSKRGGKQARTFWVEGYATGLSVYLALLDLYRWQLRDTVIVAFSAGGIARHAKQGIVIADHDYHRCSNPQCRHVWGGKWQDDECPRCQGRRIVKPTGERVARQTGLAWWQPHMAGDDANDYANRFGTEVLADRLYEVIHGKSRAF